MEINRNQYFMIGLVLFFLGVQFRMTETIILTSKCTDFLEERAKRLAIAGSSISGNEEQAQQQAQVEAEPVSREIDPPDWLGWALLSIGAVFVLHSLAMPRPE